MTTPIKIEELNSKFATETGLPAPQLREGQLSFQITWACDIGCSHCCQERNDIVLDESRIKQMIRYFDSKDLVSSVGITGGEPFLEFDLLKRIIDFCRERKLPTGVVTNATWARSFEFAEQTLGELVDAGLDHIVISYDAYHAQYVPLQSIIYAVEAAKRHKIHCEIYATAGTDKVGKMSERTAAKLERMLGVQVSVRTIVPVERAKEVELSSHTVNGIELDWKCPNKELATVWPTGEIMPCCSAGTHPKLAICNINQSEMETIENAMRSNRYLNELKNGSLEALFDKLSEENKKSVLKNHYASTCHLCYDIVERLPESDNYLSKQAASPIFHDFGAGIFQAKSQHIRRSLEQAYNYAASSSNYEPTRVANPNSNGRVAFKVDSEVRSAQYIAELSTEKFMANYRSYILSQFSELVHSYTELELSHTQVLKYQKHGHYSAHTDTGATCTNRFYTIITWLNNDFEGGELLFPELQFKFRPVTGNTIFFPSGYLHEALPVIDGTKYILVTWLEAQKPVKFF